MLSLNDKISIRQLQILLILDVLGTGVTALPRVTASIAGRSGWLCVLGATGLAAAAAWLMMTLALRFPGKTFPEYSAMLLSRPLGMIAAAVLIAKITAGCAFELRVFGEIVRRTMLPQTPFAIVCGVLLLVAAYAAGKGYETRARIAEILIFIVILPLVFIFGLAAREIDFSNLLPLFDADAQGILRGTAEAGFAFTGIEFALLAVPYLAKPVGARKGVVGAVVVTGLLMAVITVFTLARFGAANVLNRLWPVLDMMDTVELPGSFIERQEALMMSLWIVSLFAVVNAGLFFSSVLLRDTVKKGKHYMYVLGLLPVMFALAYWPSDAEQAYAFMRGLNLTLGLAFYAGIVPLLFVAALLRKAGERRA